MLNRDDKFSRRRKNTTADEIHSEGSNNSQKQSYSSTGKDHFSFDFDENTNELVIRKGNVEIKRVDVERRGKKGDDGERGPKGETGDEGPRGPRGNQGDRGERGEQGYRGDVGPQGPRGNQGETGPQGLQGEKGEKGDQGIQGIKGETGDKGADGDTWEPRLSPDGESIYFVNSKGEKSPTFQILGKRGLKGDAGAPGAKGERGEQGDTWEPRFSDDNTEIYFQNKRTGEVTSSVTIKGDTGNQGIQGPQGESAYEIWKKEGYDGDFHDFLLWIAEQAQKGADGQDGDTFRPHIEKGGHLFFISTKTGERIDGGWVKGEKGDQGETGLNGHNVTHKYGYKEIYDWTCPVQEINPHLIASSDDLASGGSAEKHMRETLNRIKNIRKQGEKKENSGSWIQEAFWWCSGADKRLLRMCPAEHSKYMGIGTVIFFTALMAMISSFFAISYVFGNADMSSEKWQTWLFSIAFAIMWGLMIFFLDRFITNTMYSDGKVTISWLELRSALPRILISIFLGIVISAPLELKIFDQEVTEQIISNRKEYLKKSLASDTTSLKKEYNIISAEIDRRKGNIQTIQAYRHEVDSLGKVVREAQNKVGNLKDNAQPKWNPKTDPDQSLYRQQLAAWQAGRKSNSESNQADKEAAGSGDKQKIDSLNNKIASLSAQLDTSRLVIERNEINNKIKRYVSNFDLKTQDDSLKSYAISSGLYEHLAALHAIAYQEDKEDGYHEWNWVKSWWWIISLGVFILLIFVSLPFLQNVVKGDESEDGNTAHVNNPKTKGAFILYPWFAVTALICGYFANTLFNALPYYIFTAVGMIMMLFILIDVSPVFYKMMLADGQYEQYLHKEKSITQDLVRLNFAKSIAKVNESEIGRLAPLIFSKPFKKIKHILTKSDNIQKEELGWIAKDQDGNVIETAYESIRTENRDVFETVLGMKKAIIEASYQAWYRDMRDAIIGMHKPGEPNGGPAPSDDTPNNPNDPSAHARRDTGHHTSEDEPFNEENYYGNTTGTSPEYDASSDDPHPETPEDFLNEEDSHLHNHTDEDANGADSDEQDDDDSLNDVTSPSSDDDSSEETDDEDEPSSETTSNGETVHPDADVESEVSDDDDDDDTIDPK